MILAFSDVEIDFARGEFRRHGHRLAIAPRIVSLLHLLAAIAERMVTKDGIVDEVWDGRVISQSTNSAAIKEARQAIGDSGAEQNLIRMLHGRGYRCVAEVRILPLPESSMPVVAAVSDLVPEPGLIAGKPSVAVLPFGNVTAASAKAARGIFNHDQQ